MNLKTIPKLILKLLLEVTFHITYTSNTKNGALNIEDTES